MSLGAGALQVEGPGREEGSIAMKVTMETMRAPTTWHRHTECSVEYLPDPILTNDFGRRRGSTKPTATVNLASEMIRNHQPCKASDAKLCEHM